MKCSELLMSHHGYLFLDGYLLVESLPLFCTDQMNLWGGFWILAFLEAAPATKSSRMSNMGSSLPSVPRLRRPKNPDLSPPKNSDPRSFYMMSWDTYWYVLTMPKATSCPWHLCLSVSLAKRPWEKHLT